MYGGLARKFTRMFNANAKNINIKVKSAGEMIRALDANYKGVKELIRRGHYRIVRGLSVTDDGIDITEQEINMKFEDEDWHIIPTAVGCKSSSGLMLTVMMGVAIIITSMYLGPAGAYMAGVGTTTIGATAAYIGVMVGVALVMGGISGLLMGSTYDSRETDQKPSYLFNGPTNSTQPGLAIPLVYGESHIGSIFISGGLEVIDI
jgi:predicted phage tail protein